MSPSNSKSNSWASSPDGSDLEAKLQWMEEEQKWHAAEWAEEEKCNWERLAEVKRKAAERKAKLEAEWKSKEEAEKKEAKQKALEAKRLQAAVAEVKAKAAAEAEKLCAQHEKESC